MGSGTPEQGTAHFPMKGPEEWSGQTRRPESLSSPDAAHEILRCSRVSREAGTHPIESLKAGVPERNPRSPFPVRKKSLVQPPRKFEWRKVSRMFELPFIVMGLGMLLYFEEWTSEKPSFMRAMVFVGAVIESTVYLAFRA